ncbi:MAG: POTRA domain-containing protein [Kofleriaceae bacterium]
MKAPLSICLALLAALCCARGASAQPAAPPAGADAPAGLAPALDAPDADPVETEAVGEAAPPSAASAAPVEADAAEDASTDPQADAAPDASAETGDDPATTLTLPGEKALETQSCEDIATPLTRRTAAGPGGPAAPVGVEPPPVPWTQWELSGKLLDRPSTLRAILDGAMQTRRALTRTARQELAEIISSLGYHLVRVTDEPIPGGGIKARLELAPRPLIRSVNVEMNQSLGEIFKVLLDDEVERRMRLRAGTYLPWSAPARACEIVREKQRIAEYLHDEGFFDADVDLSITLAGEGSARVEVKIKLGAEYHMGRIDIDQAGELALSRDEIRAEFRHQFCILEFWDLTCFGKKRFTSAQHQEDLKRLAELYQRRGFPAVRIHSNYDPKVSFEPRTKTVNVTLRIDQRRHIDVVFEGHDPDKVPDAKLRGLLTFDQAGSADDVEANASAEAITTYLQGRGYFEARVTWRRERFSSLDQVVFRITMGPSRRVRGVSYSGNRVFTDAQLTELIATRPYGQIVRIFGDAPPVTAQQLEDDAANILRAYRQRGYRDAKIEISAGPSPTSLGSVALAMAELSSTYTDGAMFVRFTIDEGRATYLRHLELDLPGQAADGALATPEDQALCDQVLAALSGWLSAPLAARRTDARRCRADANIIYREDAVAQSADAVRDFLRAQARPQASAELEIHDAAGEVVDARFTLRQLEQRAIGKVLVRGNFRTLRTVILGELGFQEGKPLTGELASDGQGRLRATGLFDRVAVSYIDDGPISHAVVQVEERYDARMRIDFELGQSSLNGFFGTIRPAAPNLLGTGLFAEGVATFGTQLRFYEGSLRVPRFLIRRAPLHLAFDAEFSAFYRKQDTDRFGELLTKGLTIASARSWQRSNREGAPARALSVGLRYDFRLRDRQVESIRVAGSDSDQTQLPVTNRTGAIGLNFEWEQRVSRAGNLSPLDPEDGYRLEASVSLASPYLLGQDTFLKLSGSAQVYWPIGKNLLLRTDLRYDHGVPLGDEAVLPELERFFAGGDSTVRGYDEDRLATEIIEQAVPPYDGPRQIRVLASSGNIRAITSVDAQLRLVGPIATAMFLDAGVVTNDWRATKVEEIRPGTGMAVRAILPFGAISLEYAIPLRPKLGDDPRGRLHFGFAMRFD